MDASRQRWYYLGAGNRGLISVKTRRGHPLDGAYTNREGEEINPPLLH